MSAQGKITVSNPPQVAELNSLGRVVEKTRKEQQKELAHLGTLTRMLEEELKKAGSEASAKAPQESQGETLAQLAYDLEMLKNTFEKYESVQIDDDGVVADQVINTDKQAKDYGWEKFWRQTKHYFTPFKHHHHNNTPPLLSLSTYFEELKEKEGKDQNQMLTTLISALQNLEEAKTQGQGGEDAFEKGMSGLAYVLQMLQVMISKYGNIQAKNNYLISEKEVTMAQKNFQDLEHKLKKLAKKRKEENVAKIFMKTAEYAAAGISALVAIATCQPELFVITAVSIAAATGATGEVTKGLTQGIELIPGVSKKTAEIIAGVTVTLLITALCLMAAPAGAAQGAADATEGESTGALARLSKLNPLRTLPKAANFAILGATTGISSTGLMNAILEAIPMSQKKRENYEIAMTVVMAVLSLLSMGAGAAAMEGVGSQTTEMGATLRKMVSYTPEILAVTALVQGGSGITEGVYVITQALLEGDLAKINAGFTLINKTVQMSSDEASDDQKHEMSQLQSIRTGNRSISKLMQGEAAFATLFAEFSPV